MTMMRRIKIPLAYLSLESYVALLYFYYEFCGCLLMFSISFNVNFFWLSPWLMYHVFKYQWKYVMCYSRILHFSFYYAWFIFEMPKGGESVCYFVTRICLWSGLIKDYTSIWRIKATTSIELDHHPNGGEFV